MSAAKKQRRAEREARRAALEAIPAAEREAMARMRIFKFYPKSASVRVAPLRVAQREHRQDCHAAWLKARETEIGRAHV